MHRAESRQTRLPTPRTYVVTPACPLIFVLFFKITMSIAETASCVDVILCGVVPFIVGMVVAFSIVYVPTLNSFARFRGADKRVSADLAPVTDAKLRSGYEQLLVSVYGLLTEFDRIRLANGTFSEAAEAAKDEVGRPFRASMRILGIEKTNIISRMETRRGTA